MRWLWAVRMATKNATGEGVLLVQLTIGQEQRKSKHASERIKAIDRHALVCTPAFVLCSARERPFTVSDWCIPDWTCVGTHMQWKIHIGTSICHLDRTRE